MNAYIYRNILHYDIVSIFIAYGLQPKSCGLIYKIPALDTVAGVAVLK